MSSLVNVTGGIKTRALTARTALGSGGSKLNVPFLFSLGFAQRLERLPGPCPGKGADWLHSVALPPNLSPSMATLSFNWNFLFQLLSELARCDLDKGRQLSYSFFLAS